MRRRSHCALSDSPTPRSASFLEHQHWWHPVAAGDDHKKSKCGNTINSEHVGTLRLSGQEPTSLAERKRDLENQHTSHGCLSELPRDVGATKKPEPADHKNRPTHNSLQCLILFGLHCVCWVLWSKRTLLEALVKRGVLVFDWSGGLRAYLPTSHVIVQSLSTKLRKMKLVFVVYEKKVQLRCPS